MSTYKELLQTARTILKQQEIADADVDAWYLLTHVFGITRAEHLLRGHEETASAQCEHFLELVELRAKHVPLQHLIGSQEFMGLEFEVNEHVLIPRQDTETLVEEVLGVSSGKTVLDMCTGSGCIIISLAKLGNIRKATGVDISAEALKVATRNARRNQVEIEWIQSDLFKQVKGSYDIVVSNPPYIPSGEIAGLMPEVKDHEPIAALDGTEDGLMFYREITSALRQFLKPGGYIFYEIGHNQGEAVQEILQRAGFTDVIIKKDLSGRDRVVAARDRN